ncbi:MAG: low molecular weight phosphatase family protein [Clostridia bacterium]|nr:low molecular weight phosphatase family protein [Clostridia bacterium]
MIKIVFVCTGNTCRSPMAQALFEKIADEKGLDAECRSCGLAACSGSPASDNSAAVLKEWGIDISYFRSSSILSLMPVLDEFDLFVPMTLNHANALLNMGIDKKKIYLFKSDVSDPFGGDINTYRKTRDELAEKLCDLSDFVESIGSVKNNANS